MKGWLLSDLRLKGQIGNHGKYSLDFQLIQFV